MRRLSRTCLARSSNEQRRPFTGAALLFHPPSFHDGSIHRRLYYNLGH